MSPVLIAVIDGMKARFLTLEFPSLPEPLNRPHLVEHKGLVSSTKDGEGQELWASDKTGRNRGSTGRSHSYDDHRENHRIEFERRFAQAISAQVVDLLEEHKIHHLILVAEPQILGIMREVLLPSLPKNLKLSELAKDLCQFKPNELHEYLVSKELLPALNKA